MSTLLPDRLKDLWHAVQDGRHTPDEYTEAHGRWLEEHRQIWARALLLDGEQDLTRSLLVELARYTGCDDLAEVRRRCQQGGADVKREWQEKVRPADRGSIARFYDETEAMLYELTWWHTVEEDVSPLAYVVALDLALQRSCRRYLDFGAGIGSGAILFGRHGVEVTVADISSSLLRFSAWRLGRRGLPARYLDLKSAGLPAAAFDFITAMDVFEHLPDPAETAERLWAALRPGGLLYARLAAAPDEERPQHISFDFAPTFDRMKQLGFVEVWRDEWLWGHQVFQKPGPAG